MKILLLLFLILSVFNPAFAENYDEQVANLEAIIRLVPQKNLTIKKSKERNLAKKQVENLKIMASIMSAAKKEDMDQKGADFKELKKFYKFISKKTKASVFPSLDSFAEYLVLLSDQRKLEAHPDKETLANAILGIKTFNRRIPVERFSYETVLEEERQDEENDEFKISLSYREAQDELDLEQPCPICLSELDNSALLWPECGHLFCRSCVQNFERKELTNCPICRQCQ